MTSMQSRRFGYNSLRQLFQTTVSPRPGSPGGWAAVIMGPDAEHELSERQLDHWQAMDAHQRLSWMIGQLWTCSSIMPGICCDDMKLPRGSSYARGARKLKTELARF